MPSSLSSYFIYVVIALFLCGLGIVLWRRLRRHKKLEIREQLQLGAAGGWLKNHPDILPQQIEFDGEKVYFVQTGKGPDVVLLHGIGASVFTWRFTILQLAKSYRVTALDIPGFGRSSKRAQADYGLDAQRIRVNTFLNKLDIKRAYLVGSSMGGTIALWMAHEDPERFPKVAALAPATSPELIPRRLSQAVAHAPLTHKVLNRFTMKLILGNVLAKRDLINSETIEAYLEPFLDEGLSVRTFLAALQLLGDRRMPNCFEGTRSEVLLIQGIRDRMVTIGSVRRLAKIIPHAEVVTSPSGGHHIMEDEPEWTSDQLHRFFGTV